MPPAGGGGLVPPGGGIGGGSCGGVVGGLTGSVPSQLVARVEAMENRKLPILDTFPVGISAGGTVGCPPGPPPVLSFGSSDGGCCGCISLTCIEDQSILSAFFQ